MQTSALNLWALDLVRMEYDGAAVTVAEGDNTVEFDEKESIMLPAAEWDAIMT